MKLRQKQIYIRSLEEAILEGLRLKAAKIVILPLHVVGGTDLAQLQGQVDLYGRDGQIKVLKPLLSSEEDCEEMAMYILESADKQPIDRGILCVGHGVSDESHRWYKKLESSLGKGNRKCLVTTLNVSQEDLLKKIIDSSVQELVMIPLFVVAGYHVTKDLYNKKSSIRQCLIDNGVKVTSQSKGIISNKQIVQMYIRKLK